MISQTPKQIIPLHEEIEQREENSDDHRRIKKEDVIENLQYLIDEKDKLPCSDSNEQYMGQVRKIQEAVKTIDGQLLEIKDIKNKLKEEKISANTKIVRTIGRDLEDEFGYTFNNSSRQGNPYTLFPGFKGMGLVKIHNVYHYYVGGNSSIKQKVSKAIRLRKIVAVTGDNQLVIDLFDDLSRMMSVNFVRNGQFTVLPFPLKYLREFLELDRRKPTKN